MKKFLFLISAIIGLSTAANAQSMTTGVASQYATTMTCVAVAISGTAGTPTNVATSSSTIFRAISVQNQDATANLYCSDNVNVVARSGSTLDAAIGWQIGPGNPGASTTFTLAPGEAYWCLNDTTSRTSIAVICKGH